MRPNNATEVRALLANRAIDRPRAELPAVHLVGSTATIRLFDTIDSWGEWWGMSAKEFAAALDSLPPDIQTIELLINSPGGEAWEGVAIVNVMRAHKARVVAVVQGIAASAASLIACAADETIMAPNSTLMIHDAWGICVGNVDDMLAAGEMLDGLSADYADVYAAKSGKSVDEMRTLMKAETFLSAAAAVDLGLADSVSATSAPEPAASLDDSAILAEFAAAMAEFRKLGITIPSAGEREDPTIDTAGEPASVDNEQASRLLAALTINKENTHE